jgi:hypothetical protein
MKMLMSVDWEDRKILKSNNNFTRPTDFIVINYIKEPRKYKSYFPSQK